MYEIVTENNSYQMAKRQKWTKEEDSVLKELVGDSSTGEPDWTWVARQMRERGIPKDRKQVSERWLNILSPDVDTSSFSREEVSALFAHQSTYKNQWRKIAEHFPGKTDNLIKNKFFALTRKALRFGAKLTNRQDSTLWVNSIKPKVIIEFMDSQFAVPNHCDESTFQGERVSARKIVEFLALHKTFTSPVRLSPNDYGLISSFLSALHQANLQYTSQNSDPLIVELQIPKPARKIRKIVKVGSKAPRKSLENTFSLTQASASITQPAQLAELDFKVPRERVPLLDLSSDEYESRLIPETNPLPGSFPITRRCEGPEILNFGPLADTPRKFSTPLSLNDRFRESTHPELLDSDQIAYHDVWPFFSHGNSKSAI